MNTTNDEQGKYGEQPKREPLSDLHELQAIAARKGLSDYAGGMGDAIRMVEAKITKGELIPKAQYDALMKRFVDAQLDRTSTNLSDIQNWENQGGA